MSEPRRITRTDPLLTQIEAAKVLANSPRTLERWRAQQFGPAFIRISAKSVRYRLSDLLKWLAERKVENHINNFSGV
jgi:predicted DNA-binding transcriptional regulator AlpA